jgi:hypothetical protein
MWQMDGTMQSMIHSSQPLVFGAKSHTNAKKLVAYSFLLGGKIYQILKKKLKSFSPHLDLDFCLEAIF